MHIEQSMTKYHGKHLVSLFSEFLSVFEFSFEEYSPNQKYQQAKTEHQ